jgi:hypothetical protein
MALAHKRLEELFRNLGPVYQSGFDMNSLTGWKQYSARF